MDARQLASQAETIRSINRALNAEALKQEGVYILDYDGLVARFRGEPVPATGVSIGVSRLAAVLRYLGKLDSKPEPGPVVVTVFDKDRLADYQTMVATLRAAGIRADS